MFPADVAFIFSFFFCEFVCLNSRLFVCSLPSGQGTERKWYDMIWYYHEDSRFYHRFPLWPDSVIVRFHGSFHCCLLRTLKYIGVFLKVSFPNFVILDPPPPNVDDRAIFGQKWCFRMSNDEVIGSLLSLSGKKVPKSFCGHQFFSLLQIFPTI